MLVTSTLSFTYDNQRVFNYPEIECARGEQLLIYGNSGSGKSTLLHLLAGFIQPNSGSIKIDNVDITKLKYRSLDKYRGKKTGFIPQKFHFIPSLNVRDNILAACFFANNPVDINHLKLISDTLEITHLLDRKPRNLSFGEQQRACIARAIINSPAVILADEPTSNLDDRNTENVMRLLERVYKLDNSSLIVVSHDERIKSRIHQHILMK